MTGGANFLQSLGWAVLNSLWQLALLWVLYQLITGIYRKMGSSARSSLAMILLLAGFGWFIFTFFSVFGKATSSHIIAESPLVNAGTNPELNDWLQNTLPLASIAYLVLLIFPSLHFLRNYRYVQVIRRYGLSKIDVDWRIFVKNIAARMGIRQDVKIWVSEFVSSPVTIGFLKPVILVPLAAINHLTPQQLEAVLLHELSHIRRYDYLLNLVLHFIHTILYFNPFAKAFVQIVEKEREKSCDELVLQFQYDSHEYASALLTLEKAGQASKTFTMAASGRKADLLTRVELILGVHKKPVLSFNRLAGFMAGLLCVIGLNAILIISKPANGSKAYSYANLKTASRYISNTTRAVSEAPVEINEENPSAVINHLDLDRSDDEIAVQKPEISNVISSGFMASLIDHKDFIPVNLVEVVAPVLTMDQEKQVKAALDASRKVMENTQWKAMEKNIADVFTNKEKEELKKMYSREFEKFNWNEWEQKLSYAYNSVDWEKVNQQLNSAVNEIRLDSLQVVYNEAIGKINQAQRELELNMVESIPDTEIDQNLLERRKNELKRELNRVKAVRNKKVVHL